MYHLTYTVHSTDRPGNEETDITIETLQRKIPFALNIIDKG